MSVETENRMDLEELQRRVEKLESRRPERGPAGDISAALENVMEKLPGLIEENLKRRGLLDPDGSVRRGPTGERGPVGQSITGPRGEKGATGSPTQEEINSLVIKALEEQQFINPDTGGPGALLMYEFARVLARFGLIKESEVTYK